MSSLDMNAFLPYVNGPLGFLFRRALWIPDRAHRIIKLAPNAHHLHLGGERYRSIFYPNGQHMQAAYKNLDWFMRSLHRWDMAAARLSPVLNAGFDTFTSQPAEASANDTYIESGANQSVNYGTSGALQVGESSTSAVVFRALIEFDLTSITWSVLVSSAVLSLWLYSNSANFSRAARVYRQKRAWVETQATWNIYSTGNNWSTVGGFHEDDCEQTDIGSLSLASTESSGEKQWSLTTTAIDAILDGRWTNNGFLIKNDEENNDLHLFRSAAYATASERPQLELEYQSQDTGGLLL